MFRMRQTPDTEREGGRVASAWAFSVVGHLVVLGLGGILVANSLRAKPSSTAPPPLAAPAEEVVPVELPEVVDGSLAAPSPSPDLPRLSVPRGGGEATPRLDTGRRGRGGDGASPTSAINLADRDDGLLMSPEIQSRFDRAQVQRLRSASHRASREDLRASREPMELTFLAEGRSGHRHERRAAGDRDPSLGADASGAPSRIGGAIGAAAVPPGVGEASRATGGPVAGALQASSGVGVRDGFAGRDHRATASVDHGRPRVAEGTPSVPADAQGRPSDNVDSEQEVASLVQSIVHASTAGGAQGAGASGVAGGGAPGAGGVTGPGSIARALGTGQGSGLDNDPRDPRRTDYMRRILAKIYPYTADAMPKWALYEGAQGITIVSFTIQSDGAVTGVTVTRPSGLPELDENCRRAVLRSAPFPPLPSELGTSFRWAMPFDFRNPAVRPRTARLAPEGSNP